VCVNDFFGNRKVFVCVVCDEAEWRRPSVVSTDKYMPLLSLGGVDPTLIGSKKSKTTNNTMYQVPEGGSRVCTSQYLVVTSHGKKTSI
jgi:hypothetical protein